ncbi:anucleate primary sterigmata protein a protein [Mucor ambiguus]|uniref:Anucleate primary sterigmata protein a protein n=1 Tax=Mucor ambiguus TaxID=91626 RepID=A0A0C9M2E4_9FUNG|nr:anucleate primary sterigmata protein a protein [Mucor ambiguus]
MSSPPPKQSLSSPTSGNTPQPVLPTPSSSTSVSLRQLNHNKQSQMRRELEQQLIEKQRQLQESNSGIGKNVLARQVSQLQDRLKEMDNNISHEELQPTSSVDRLRSLERDLSSYRSHPLSPGISSIRNKEKLLNQRSPTHTTTSANSTGLDPLPSPTTSTLLPPAHGHDSTSMLPLPPPPTGSTPTKRRSKIPNTDRRNTDIEFATEIGQGLLLEVRKMQALLQEKEEKLRTLENQKADLERAAEAMAKQMRQREENEEKLKEETWNLELAKQELVVSVTDLQTNLSKANAEQNKLAKQVNELRTEIEQLRDREEKLTTTIDNMKQRHEQDMSSLRRHAAGIQREKSDQSKQIEALTSELAIAKAQSRIGKHASMEADAHLRRSDKEQTDSDQAKSTLAVKNDSSPSTSPPSSPKQSPTRNQAMEVETLKTSLAHAHRIISGLRSNLHKEKTEKFEFKKLLAESQETIEQLQNDPRMWVDAGPTRGTGGASSNISARMEDGQFGGRRSHKASTSSISKRRGKKTLDPRRSNSNKLSKSRIAGDDDSVYSYTSMSDNDDSELDSFDESDADVTNATFNSSKPASRKAAAIGFTPLSSELSQSQARKPVAVDAQVNTDTLDALPPLAAVIRTDASSTVPRSLGDELGMAMSRTSPTAAAATPQEPSITNSIKNATGGIATALGIDALLDNDKKASVEISTQTEEEPAKATACEISTQTEQASLQDATQAAVSVAPEDPSIAQAALAAAIAESRKAALENAVDQQVQSEPEDPSIAEAALAAATAAAVLASRKEALASAVDQEIQCDPEDPSIAEAATAAAIAASPALDSAIDHETQSDPEDPSVQEALIAAATAAAMLDSRKQALASAVDQEIQCDPEDPSIAEAAAAAAIAASPALDSAIDHETQSDPEDPSVQEALLANALSASRQSALASAIDQEIQCNPEDPAIAEAALAAAAAAAVLASRQEAFASGVHQETQSETEDPSIAEAGMAASNAAAIAASRSAAIESAVEQGTQCEPEDPSVALAATAAAIAASRKAALESAISQETQSEAVPVVDHEIQCDPVVGTDCGVQSQVDSMDASIQSELMETKDSGAQYDAIDTADASVQHEETNESRELAAAAIAASALAAKELAVQHHSMGTQSEPAPTSDESTQCEVAAVLDHETQYDAPAGIDHSTQSTLAETLECGVQSEAPLTVDADVSVQHDLVDTKDAQVQYEAPDVSSSKTILPIPLVVGGHGDQDKEALAVPATSTEEDDEEFFDASADSKPSSRNTIKNAAVFNNASPSSRDIKPTSFIVDEQTKEEKDGHRTPIVAATAAAVVASRSISTTEASPNSTADVLHEIASEPQHGGVTEKVFTKAETDALIASAVALALSNAAAFQKKEEPITEILDVDDVEQEDSKRHTCDMSHNNNNNSKTIAPSHDADSAVVSHSSGIVSRDDEEPVSEEDYGNVVVHLPREEDTITSSPYHDKRQQQRELEELAILSRHDQVPRHVGNEFEHHASKPRSLELSMGPAMTFGKAPVDATNDATKGDVTGVVAGVVSDHQQQETDEEDIMDIPVRPANPPPAALLSRAAFSPTFNERYKSPVSAPSSKGKAPYDSYSGLSSPTTNDDNQPSSSRLDLNKRGSVSASSLSTTNTNEQLQSITSSQYDPSGRGSTGAGTTDPNMINLITQTMIGDWMYKYTRKAVGGGLSENRHQRYFWIHPYTNTLYWSTAGPGGNGNGHEAKAKCALIENITAVPDYTSNANGLPNVSLLIQTSQRQLKLTAPTMEKHERWLESIQYLIARNANGSNAGLTLLNDASRRGAEGNMNNRSISSGTTGSLLNRPSFRRIHDIFQQPSVSTSAPSMATSTGDDHIDLDDEEDEALEDVRMCCNGKHHVSKLEKDHAHRHHYRKRKSHHDKSRNTIPTVG